MLQGTGVIMLWRTLPVVVEVREECEVRRPALQSLRPLVELRMRVVAVRASGGAVEGRA